MKQLHTEQQQTSASYHTHQSPKKSKKLHKKKKIYRRRNGSSTSSHVDPNNSGTGQLPIVSHCQCCVKSKEDLKIRCKRSVLFMLRDLFKKSSRYQWLYLMSLQILRKLEFEGQLELCLKVATTIYLIVSKYGQVQKPKIADLVSWSGKRVTKQQIEDCEYQILTGLDFQMPSFQELNEQQMKQQTEALQYNLQNWNYL